MSRRVRNHKHHTPVYLNMGLHAILDVRETEQTLKTYIWIYMEWDNDFTRWNPDDFCGLKHVIVPKEALWQPDLNIEEMIETNDSPPSPYLNIMSDGKVKFRKDQVVITTCKMHVYKFPFDTQNCSITFKSLVFSDEEIRLRTNKNNTAISERSRRMMRKEYEWVFVDMNVKKETFNHFGFYQNRIVYTIKMERRSVLYIANFLLPVFFFLCLDLASFLISDTGGEKLGYKITVLLAVTVMQLILNEILPSSSNRIPLIAVYCIGIFSLMLLSLLETILVMHLIEKDATTQDNETDGEQTPKGRCGDFSSSDAQYMVNQSLGETPGNNSNSEFYGDELAFNRSSENISVFLSYHPSFSPVDFFNPELEDMS
ncbi:5-hydroxytryptamine receptor 3A-like [Mugil cephalus]|uniref:5-hydroxytryptamine receptor 3A-like n=1 Tax=Mugil cephalus TaxID=48193 RepID=UPI001FB5B7DB|nr:5-hydroxytryptamine receptor 3A-like [Mugil cephalus]